MSVDVEIEELLHGRLKSLALDPPLPVAWPNVAFKPSSDPKKGNLPYLVAYFLPAVTRAFSIEAVPATSDVRKGVYQVSVYWPVNEGSTVPKRAAAAIVDWFSRGLDLRGAVARVRLGAAYVSAAMREDAYYVLPVTVPWTVFT